MAFVDGAIGTMLSAIRAQGLANSTAVIITAKHGESPLTSTRTVVDQTAIGAIVSAGGVPVTASPTSPPVAVSGPLTVFTRQIAPTVLSMLGLNPAALDAVRVEGIGSLPEVITRLDTTPPVIVPTVTPSPNVNGWNNSDVSVSWSVTDPE